MLKRVLGKIVVGGFLLAMVGAIVVGAISLAAPSEEAHAQSGAGRGSQRTEQAAVDGQGQGWGRGRNLDQAGQDGSGKAVGDEACADENTARRQGGNGQASGEGGQGQGQGQGRGRAVDEATLGGGLGQGNDGQGSGGQGNGGQGNGSARGGNGQGQRSGEPQAEIEDWQIIEGLVVETDELVVETADGQTVQVGLGPSQYREGQGFALTLGAKVRVSGYWEEDEFKAMQVENLDTGKSIVLRDVSGRPMWAGQGRRSG
jgi:hypothetical protein